MPKREKGMSTAVDEKAVMEEYRKVVERLRKGEISREEFGEWFRSHFGIKGKGILRNFLKQRELARGWDKNPKRKRKKSLL
ncbi:MAG: hypothetical protein NZ937_06295 [Armatimonadetes bacterium]|nr:hypothetical protein [Armatimonadota bacterium]